MPEMKTILEILIEVYNQMLDAHVRNEIDLESYRARLLTSAVGQETVTFNQEIIKLEKSTKDSAGVIRRVEARIAEEKKHQKKAN
jgi:hypothetical protein